jgi:glycosyltransferase involved in cell wall biosynthesis
MQTHGLVSIITPSYNCAAFISETIEAIQAQTYTDWELLITDDCSTDNSIEIINRYADNDPRIILIRLKQNSGAGVARNHAIDCAKGQYIAFCDSDDRWFPEKLEKQISLMKSKGIALCYSSYMTCNEKGDINGIIVAPKKISYNDILKDDSMYNPQNETEDGNKSKRPKIKTKRDSPQNEAYLRVRFFNRPPYPIFAPKSTRLRRGQG